MSAISFSGLTIYNILISIRDSLKYICSPAWVDKSLNRVRVTEIIESGTVTTVTTVSNLDGYQAKLPAINANMAAWQLAVRSRIS